MIIFIEILSIKLTACFQTQVNGKCRRNERGKGGGTEEGENVTCRRTKALNLDRNCFKSWLYNFTCVQIH